MVFSDVVSPGVMAAGSAALPGAFFGGDRDTGFWSSAANIINLSVGGAEIAEFDAARFDFAVPIVEVAQSSAGVTTRLNINNNESANAASHAEIHVASNGVSGGDPFIHFRIGGVQSMSMGLDNTNSDLLVWSPAEGVGTNDRMRLVPSTGVLSVDGDGGGSDDPVSLFDSYDDALALRAFQLSATDIERTDLITTEQREMNRAMLFDMGITEYAEQDDGPDHMMIRLQPMMRLLAGGVYQNRQKLDVLETENRTLRALVEAN